MSPAWYLFAATMVGQVALTLMIEREPAKTRLAAAIVR